MKLIYEASNTIEAHMILNLIEHAGLTGRVDGEYLQGGVGELQAIGIVRVLVEDQDFIEANKIVQEWDLNQPKFSYENERNSGGALAGGVIGFIAGLVVLTIYYNTPVTSEGIDYNGDNKLDEKWTYKNDRISKVEIDSDFDGRIDFIFKYNRKGLVVASESDENLDGSFETNVSYKDGQPALAETDTTGDGFKDIRTIYESGRLSFTTR